MFYIGIDVGKRHHEVGVIDEKGQPIGKTLRLAYVADIYESIPFEDETQYLMDLLKKEIQLRDEAKGKRLIKKAKFISVKTLDTFQWTEQIHFPPHLNISSLCSLDFIRNRENVVLVGAPGTGKTHLATGLGHKACLEGFEVRFYRVSDL